MKEERRKIGKCVWCSKWVYSDKPWVMISKELPKVAQYYRRDGPLHTKCKAPYFKVTIMDLMADIMGFEFIVDGLSHSIKTNKTKGDKNNNNK